MLTLDDLTKDLVWPVLLKAGALSLRPARVVLGTASFLAGALIVGVFDRLAGRGEIEPLKVLLANESTNLALVGSTATSGLADKHALLARDVYTLTIATPLNAIMQSPVAAGIGGIVLLAVMVLFGGAIARSAAADHARLGTVSLFGAIGFAIRRWLSLIGAIMLPIAVLWGVMLLMATAGLLLRVPGLSAVLGIAWGLMLLGGFLAALVSVAFIAGQAMLVPSVACDDSDAIDAVQRAYAFVLGRPLRLALYVGILLVQFAIMAGIVSAFVWLVVVLAQKAGMAFSSDSGLRVLSELPMLISSGVGASAYELTTSERIARGGVMVWSFLMLGAGFGWAVSYYWTASTMLYLAMRRICDGQDVHDLWAGPRRVVMASAPPADPERITQNGPADAT